MTIPKERQGVLDSARITWPYTEPLARQVNAALKGLSPGAFITISPEERFD